MLCRRSWVGAIAAFVAFAVTFRAHAEDRVTVERRALVAEALRGHPAVRAAERRAAAIRRSGEAEGSLPPPDAMVQIWQVPIARPYALRDAQMIMFGVGQTLPAPGARAARKRAAEHEADAEHVMAADVARQIRREVDHAFADYVETTERHRLHTEHRAIAMRTAALARARHEAGGSLSARAQAEVELARTEADVVADGTRVEAARARLNALLGRAPGDPLPPPYVPPAETAAWDLATAAAKAAETRPELRATTARRDARREDARAAEREAVLPSFRIAGLYFAPTSVMPQHGYGVNASVSLPWLWGEAGARRDARREAALAADSEIEAARRPILADVATAEANVRSAATRLRVLEDRALPASRRALDAAWAGYEASLTDILTLLSARRSVVDVETEILAARADLDHALAELDAAVGAEVPRRPVHEPVTDEVGHAR